MAAFRYGALSSEAVREGKPSSPVTGTCEALVWELGFMRIEEVVMSDQQSVLGTDKLGVGDLDFCS